MGCQGKSSPGKIHEVILVSSGMRTPKGDLQTIALSRATQAKYHQVFRRNEGDGEHMPPQQANETPTRIPLPFKDQRSPNKLREHLSDRSRNKNTEVHTVFTSRKIKDELKAKEPKPPIVNQQNVVYCFKCDLCYTSRHLH